ncbi:MAG: metal ABC transporter solute-binding protein, Zn/Mn family [Tepidisphaeraceae bacterium]
MTKMAFLSCCMLLGMVLTGCDSAVESSSPSQGGASGAKLRVVATTTMLGDLVKQVGGDDIDLGVIMGAGVDPHTYKPSTADLGELSRAGRVIYNGLHLEGKMVELFEEKLKGKAFAVAEAIPHERLLAWQEGQDGAHDPHIWFDVRLWSLAAEKVRDVLVEADAAHADAHRRRAGEFVAKLKTLDDYARQTLAKCPKDKRVLITSHDAYNYFGRAYEVEVLGLQGISTETEAGLANINSAVDFIVSRKIPAIFVESSVSPKTIERVRDDCKSRGFDVKIGGELYSDAMGTPGEHAGYEVHTYEGMVRYNVDTIVNALVQGQGARGEGQEKSK